MNSDVRWIHVCGMSRSGTTLLTSMLDAHPGISMGYELLPAGLPSTIQLAEAIQGAVDATDGSARAVGNRLKESGLVPSGVFVKRAARALVTPTELEVILRRLSGQGRGSLRSLAARRELSEEVVLAKMAKERTTIGGHKVGPRVARSIGVRAKDTSIVYIVRDPRDVAASQRERGFDFDMRSLARDWNRLVATARRGVGRIPTRRYTIRYEDLVEHPERSLRGISEAIKIDFEPSMLDPATSKASVLNSEVRHANAENLRREVFTSSVGRGRRELSVEDSDSLSRRCRRGLGFLDYPLT